MLSYCGERIKGGYFTLTVSYETTLNNTDTLYFTLPVSFVFNDSMGVYWYTDYIEGSFESVCYREFVEFCKALKQLPGCKAGI
jgi:hypothetical protein